MESKEKREFLLSEESPSKSSIVASKVSAGPESHLQSLGLTMDNGKARFKLNEDAPLYSNAAVSNFYAVDGDDTLSFVVLSKDSLDCIQQSSMATYVDIQEKCMCVDYNSMIASMDSSEVHQKLTELLQENTKLKETLKQNNVAMKQQFNTLATWQEEIMKVHQNHKRKFAQTRELINYLKKENTELKMRLSSDLTSHTELEYEVVSSHDQLDSAKEKKMLMSVNEISDFEKIADLEKQNTDDKKFLEQEKKQLIREREVLEEEKKLLDQLHSTKEKKILMSVNEISDFEKIADLEKQIADDKKLLEQEKKQLIREREILEEEKKLLDQQKNNLDADYKSLNDTKELLQQERIILQDEKTSLDQQSQLYESQYSSKLEMERQKFEAKIDQLSRELAVLHESINTKESTIKQLQEEVVHSKENISLLQTQILTYEEDFTQERELKEKLLKEKITLNIDLQKQIEFNEQLQQEINRIRGTERGAREFVPPTVSSYSCPKCDSTFRNVKSLEDHVHWCLGV